jgi:cell division protein FtsL
MARKTYQYNSKYKNTYVHGNTVRKLYVAEPAIETPRKENRPEEEQKQRRQQQHSIHRANRINFLYTAAVTGIVAVIFTICFQYLNLQTEVKNNASTVSTLQSQLNDLSQQNEQQELDINASIDYEEIYNTAVNELGMVYPNKGQVINYNAGESEYVKQYMDVPTSK